MTLAFYFIQSCVMIAIGVLVFKEGELYDLWVDFILYFGRFLYMMAHWLFSSQYLRTSKTFPRLLSQAKLEFAA